MHLEKKVKKRPVVVRVFEKPYFSTVFQNTHFPIWVLKLTSQLPNLISTFETHTNVCDNFLSYIYIYIWVDIYAIYIPTKYEEKWKTLLIFHPSHQSIYPSISSHPSIRKLGHYSGLVCSSALDPEETL